MWYQLSGSCANLANKMKFGAMDPNMKLVLEEMAKLHIEMECFTM
jgi:hypothetical protein